MSVSTQPLGVTCGWPEVCDAPVSCSTRGGGSRRPGVVQHQRRLCPPRCQHRAEVCDARCRAPGREAAIPFVAAPASRLCPGHLNNPLSRPCWACLGSRATIQRPDPPLLVHAKRAGRPRSSWSLTTVGRAGRWCRLGPSERRRASWAESVCTGCYAELSHQQLAVKLPAERIVPDQWLAIPAGRNRHPARQRTRPPVGCRDSRTCGARRRMRLDVADPADSHWPLSQSRRECDADSESARHPRRERGYTTGRGPFHAAPGHSATPRADRPPMRAPTAAVGVRLISDLVERHALLF